jgi:SAM-dependent methyltransferase
MALDVTDLRAFYATPLGKVSRRFIGRHVRGRWSNCAGLSVLGVGYATPYLDVYRDEAVRVLAFMPAEQGVVPWPEDGPTASALVDTTMLPLPDSCIDRALVAHALETTEHPHDFLSEIWRVLTPGGRLIVVAPSRRGLWARFDHTPFGHGKPYSPPQLRELMRETLFSPLNWTEALYVPPFERGVLLRSAPFFERIGGKFALPGGGALILEATKQLYRPVGARRAVRKSLPQFEPALAPTAVGREGS